MTASELYTMLVRRYANGYLLAPQVPEHAGFDAKSRLDAVAIATYASRGYEIHGFEIKAHRSDLLRELANPQKSAPIVRFLDFFWLVADKGLVQAAELPPTWGLLVPRGNRLQAVRRPKQLDPAPISRAFVVGLLLRMMRCGEIDDVASMLAAEYERGRLEGIREGQRRVDDQAVAYELTALRELKTAVADFEAASGIKIERWNGAQVGNALRLVLAGQAQIYEKHLSRFALTVRHILEQVDDLLEQEQGQISGGGV